MRYRVVRSAAAEHEISTLSPDTRRALNDAVRQLREGPLAADAKELDDHPDVWRVRLNKGWRMVFELQPEERVIRITRVRRRRFAYEGLERAPR